MAGILVVIVEWLLIFLGVMVALWLYRRLSLFLGTHTEIFREKRHDICNLLFKNGSEKKNVCVVYVCR